MTQVKEQEVSLYASNKRIHPKMAKGIFAKLRIWAVIATQFVFFILPWFNYDGRQAVLLDIANRHFYIFSLVLLPSDLIFLSGLLFLAAFGLFWWTTIAGRLWCGYACPQTVYTEIMLWFDHFFEGDRNKRLKLEKSPWNFYKIRVKSLKYLTILIFCAWVGLSFVGWFSPIRGVFADFIHFNLSATEWFSAAFYGACTFFLAHIMREQVCKYMCPYARFQSAMFDRDTLIISYDPERGEPRGVVRKRKTAQVEEAPKGDCVDCSLCVQVCPVGIDIREGLQYECIGCAACIDACDEVMDKLKRPRGLIRYTTEAAMEKEYPESKILSRMKRPRVMGYGVIMLAVVTALIIGLFGRELVRVDIIKDRGVLARQNNKGWTENAYTLRIMNASDHVQILNAKVSGFEEIALTGLPENFEIHPGEVISLPVQVSTPDEGETDSLSYKIGFDFFYHGKGKDPESVRQFHEEAVFIGER